MCSILCDLNLYIRQYILICHLCWNQNSLLRLRTIIQIPLVAIFLLPPVMLALYVFRGLRTVVQIPLLVIFLLSPVMLVLYVLRGLYLVVIFPW
jgi:hypothetical protein